MIGSYSGDAAEFAKSLAGEPWLILAAAITIYIVLGVLYESFIHPLTILSTLPSAGVGALLALMLYRYDLSVVALIGIVLLMGIVKKNAIMMIDFALEAERKQGLSPREVDRPGLAPAFPADHDDDARGAVRRHPAGVRKRHRLGAAQSARHHHHRRAAAQPVATLYTTPVDLSRDGAPEGAVEPAGAAADRARPAEPPEPSHNGRRSEGMSYASFSEPFIRRPVGTTLLAIGLLLVGAVAYHFLPVASMPTVDFPTISVTASRPGADPETMAATVAAPLERRLGEIPGVTELTSRSSLGSTRISVQFDLNRNIDGAARDVQAAINAALTDLPSDLPSRPSFRKSNPAATPIMILALTSKTVPPSALYDAADTVIVAAPVADRRRRRGQRQRRRAARDPRSREPDRARLHGPRHGGRAHRRSPMPMRPGRSACFDGSERAITIGSNDQLRTAPDYDDDRGAHRQRHGGAARRRSPRSRPGVRNSRSAGWFNGEPSVLLVINKQANSNVIETVDRIYELLPEIKRWIPAGIEISVLSDRTQTIRASIHDMQLTLLATIVLVMLVVFVFLRRAAATIAAGVTVPLSLAGTCAMMWVAGFSIDNLSLMALAVSVGFVVDDAIVMIENCFRNLEKGHVAVARRASKARSRSASRCSRSASRWSRPSSRCCS